MIAPHPVVSWLMSERMASDESMAVDPALVALIEVNLDRAYRMAGLILGDAAEAEEVVGDALEAALRHRRDLRDPARFEAWFDRIVVNRCRDRLRRRNRVRFIALPDDAVDRRDPFSDVLARDEALHALASLPPDERLVLVLHFWADLTLDTVASRIGWPLGTVKSRLHRGLERLRRGQLGAVVSED